ncbi:hypothetical protein [Klebsiella aerogenes]|uniref:hypothetical protein n=1 Tax=Klebsiella aerogenes TaxID=548 RepID=UPI0034D2D9AC
MSEKPSLTHKLCLFFNVSKERLTGKWFFGLLLSSFVIFVTQRLGNLFPDPLPALHRPTAMQMVLIAVGFLLSITLNMAEIRFSRCNKRVGIIRQLREAISYPFPLLLGFCAAFFWQTSSVIFAVYGAGFLFVAALYEVLPLYIARRCCTTRMTF